MKKIIPSISVDNCSEALEFYKNVFGGEVKNLQMADGKEMFKGFEGKIVHSELFINNDCILHLNDTFGDKKVQESNISLMLQMESLEEIERIYSAVSKNGHVIYELQKTFWGSYHAEVADSFGVRWSLEFSGR